MPLQDPRVQSALAELQRRGVIPQDEAPAGPVGGSPDTAPAPTATPAPIVAADIAPPAPAQMPAPDYSSPRDVERQLKLKQMKGDLAIQDSVNELKRRGVNLQLRTQPAQEEITTRQATEAVENARGEGDPEAFKGAWRQLFPGKSLPRKNGQIDYQTGQDDIDVEVDRRKKLEAAKVGAHNIVETKVVRNNPATGKDEEYLVRTDKMTGQVLGETKLSENQKPLTETQSNAKMFAARLGSNNQVLLGIEAKGFDPAAFGTTVQSFIPNRFRSEDAQAYNAAKQNWIGAVLRKESGAAISNKEYSDANKQYFAQDGDSKSVVLQKQALRKQVEDQMQQMVGPHAGPVQPPPILHPGTPSPAASAETPVAVNTPADAPATAKFIKAPDGRVFRNPKYQGAAQ